MPKAMPAGAYVLGLSAGIAMASAALLLLFTLYEIIVRSLGSPTTWVLDTSSYLLCAMVGASFPVITAHFGHASISLLVDMLKVPRRVAAQRAIDCVCGMICVVAGALCAIVLVRQYSQGITTLSAVVIPKWTLTAALVYGFWASGLVHFANAITGRTFDRPEETV